MAWKTCGHRRRKTASQIGAGVSYSDAFSHASARIRPSAAARPPRRRAGAQHGHDRRQCRQRLADRRYAAAADRARRQRDSARGKNGARCRSRTSSSPTASRTASPANSSRRFTCRSPARTMHFAVYKITKRRDEDITAVSAPSICAGEERHGQRHPHRLWRHGRDAEAGERSRSGAASANPGRKQPSKRRWPHTIRTSTPLTDMRATAAYRTLTAKNLLRRFYVETTGTTAPSRSPETCGVRAWP